MCKLEYACTRHLTETNLFNYRLLLKQYVDVSSGVHLIMKQRFN